MDYVRSQLLSWSEFIKITKFHKQLHVSKVAISNYLKYGTKSLSDQKILELYNLVLDYMKKNFA